MIRKFSCRATAVGVGVLVGSVLTCGNLNAQSAAGSEAPASAATPAPAKPGFFSALSTAMRNSANKNALASPGSSTTSVVQSDPTLWEIEGLKLGNSVNAVEATMRRSGRARDKQFEQPFRTTSGAFTTSKVVMGTNYSTIPSGSAGDQTGTLPSRALLEVGYSWPTPGEVYAVNYSARYDNPQHYSVDSLASFSAIKQKVFAQFGNPNYVKENPISGRTTPPVNEDMGKWDTNTGSVSWVWTANSDYQSPAEFYSCTDIKLITSALGWMRGNAGSTRMTAPKCGAFLRVDLQRVDVDHVYLLTATMIDQKGFADWSSRFDAYLDKGESAAQTVAVTVPSIKETPLIKLFESHPYDGTPKTYYPRVAITVTDWGRPKCWFAKATLWWSAVKSEPVGPFQTCWTGGNFQWHLSSVEAERQFEAQQTAESSGNVRSTGPRAPLRAGLASVPGDAVEGYNDFIHAFEQYSGWQPGAPTNIWLVGFAAGKP